MRLYIFSRRCWSTHTEGSKANVSAFAFFDCDIASHHVARVFEERPFADVSDSLTNFSNKSAHKRETQAGIISEARESVGFNPSGHIIEKYILHSNVSLVSSISQKFVYPQIYHKFIHTHTHKHEIYIKYIPNSSIFHTSNLKDV